MLIKDHVLETLVEGSVIFLFCFLILFSVFAVVSCNNKHECLERGFAKSVTTIYLSGYCVNGTDVVEL